MLGGVDPGFHPTLDFSLGNWRGKNGNVRPGRDQITSQVCLLHVNKGVE